MRTTLDIEDDVLQAAREMAEREGSTTGRMISALARRGLQAPVPATVSAAKMKNGVPILPSRGEIVTVEKIRRLMEEEGI